VVQDDANQISKKEESKNNILTAPGHRERGDSSSHDTHHGFSILDFGFQIESKIGNPKSKMVVPWRGENSSAAPQL
jgi:hypothetical protein